MNRSLTMLFATYFACVGAASATCSRSYVLTSTPRWSSTVQEWYYSGSQSASTGITNAAADWNAAAEGTLTLNSYMHYEDYVISDDDSIAPNEGFTSWTTQADNPGCANKLDSCGACMNSSVLYQVKIKLNWNGESGIVATHNDLSWTIDQTVEEIMSHEFGHSYRLGGDFTGTPNCTEPSVMSKVDPGNCTPNFFGPTSCDTDNFNSAYSGWTVTDFSMCGMCTTTGC